MKEGRLHDERIGHGPDQLRSATAIVVVRRHLRTATPAEAERLGISTGTPVAEHVRTGYTTGNRPVRVMVSVFRAAR